VIIQDGSHETDSYIIIQEKEASGGATVSPYISTPSYPYSYS